jgi:hypothetical protein
MIIMPRNMLLISQQKLDFSEIMNTDQVKSISVKILGLFKQKQIGIQSLLNMTPIERQSRTQYMAKAGAVMKHS